MCVDCVLKGFGFGANSEKWNKKIKTENQNQKFRLSFGFILVYK